MTKNRLSIATVVVAFALPAAGATLPPETELVADGPLTVNAADFEGYMLRVPENRRGDVRTSYERVATIVDNLYVTRSMAAKARSAGIDQDPVVQRRLLQVQEALLADLYVRKMEMETAKVDLEARAREIFKAEHAKRLTPEQIYTQQIVVGLNGRTREMALERARQALEEAKAGKDFLALASEYADAPDPRRKVGDIGYKSSYAPPIAKALEGMKKKGEIAGPIETENGFHVIKFIDRIAGQPVTYEAIRRKLIEAEREKLQKNRLEDLFAEIRSSASTKVHPENVEKLVVPVDLSKMLQSAGELSPQKP